MICRKIYRTYSCCFSQWWRSVYSATAPPPSAAGVAGARSGISEMGFMHRCEVSVFSGTRTLFFLRNPSGGNASSISFGTKCRKFTTQAVSDLPTDGVVDIPLAQTGEGIAECELLKWFVDEGDQVEEFQPLCEVQSDKATIEITSRYKGKVLKFLHVPGSNVKVGETLLKMVVDENAFSSQSTEAPEVINAQDISITGLDAVDLGLKRAKAGGVLSTPAVRNFAKQLGVNIEDVIGTGKEGRVLKEDVLSYATSQGIFKESSEFSNASCGEQYVQDHQKLPYISPPYKLEFDRTIQLRGFQRAMVKSMTLAAKIPHFYYVDEINCNALVELKASFQNENSDPSVKHTFLPSLIKSLSMALSKYPLLNSCFSEELQEVTLKGSHNIGIAMATPHGLVVPNIKKVHTLSILEITKELSRLQQLALANKLSSDDITGGTFTLSNIGAIGGKFGSPLINVPEVSIIAMGRIQKVPKFDDDENVYPASIMTVNIGADHRVLDGATVAKFCNEWKIYIEKPELMMLHMR
ncbi:Lipoamide acyltransferase component of branched-chain alpha-keto acid dehydrogenase complex-mitochondrial [Striga hermonthica]|uniref:Dihydrolipoamide acetyltransferase component of pyruvate dehydrogenase complex n=1 Tax=Striga hermonthica TaxID=68872 RepID=A0A9N7MXW3_STRHE|nr:Lipoamide acyltransferase component of branched-chain alpha-keto acid dehydrogenase complex-mitochondrial [Striga hermonthica]